MPSELNNYHTQIECLRHIYLEDSYVLDMTENDDAIEFKLEVVLTESHPAYMPPKPKEQYCYATAFMQLRNCAQIVWLRKSFCASIDADGAIDYGNIDYFAVFEDTMQLSGDWGELKVHCSDVELIYA